MEAESGITGLTKSSGMRALKYASIALAIALTVTTLASRISLINTHLLNIMGEEQNVVYGIIKWMQGSPLYTDPAILPMDIIQYAPSYYYLVGSIGKLIGVDPSEPQNIYALSRTVGLLLNLLFAFIGYGIARQMGAIRWVGILWGAVVFSFLPVQIYSRTDALNLVFFASAMFFFLRSLERGTEGKKILYLATIFGCLAMLSKQTGVLPLIIIGSWLLITKQWKTLFYQIIVGAVILGVAVGSMFIHYGTGVVIDNLFTSVRNGIDLVLVRSLLNVRYVAMFVLQGIGLVLAFRWWRGTEPMKRGWALAFMISLVFGYITSLKYGSSVAYYMEGLVLATAALAAIMCHRSVSWQWAGLALAILFIQPRQFAWGITVLLGRNTVQNELVEYEEAKAMAKEFAEDPALREGYILFPYHDHMENFIVGRSVLTQKDIFQLPTSIANYDLSAYRNALNDGTIRYILKRDLSIPLCVVGDDHPPLRLIGVRHGYHIYVNTAWKGAPSVN